ncbi:MAG: hypothetical protein AB7P03_30925 [Kofleriaceae bacterium]
METSLQRFAKGIYSLGLLSAFGAALVACSLGGEPVGGGGGDDGKQDTTNNDKPDAAVPALPGLGQKCDISLAGADCPANAPTCAGFSGTTTYCTPRCLTNGTGTGTANGGFNNVVPTPTNSACIAAFKGSVGTPVCFAVESWVPMDNPIVAGKTYSGLNWNCVIKCDGSGLCPVTTEAVNLGDFCLCMPQ